MSRTVLCIGVSLAACGPLCADWLDLESGVSLRGVDPKEAGGVLSFTLEDGRTLRIDRERVAAIRKSPPGETVEFRGREVSLREKVRILQAEEKARQADSMRAIEAWARGGKRGEEARMAFEGLPPEAQVKYLASALLGGAGGKARLLAAQELARRKAELPGAFVHAAVRDSDGEVRAACRTALESFASSSVGPLAIPYLSNSSEDVRIRAAGVLERHPSLQAVPALLSGRSSSGGGGRSGGRAFIFQGEQRSYIADYELVSGGTGYSLIETADPVVRTNLTGVVLDVEVRSVEVRTRVAALRKITGRDLGPDLAAWRRWWIEERASRPPGERAP